MKKILDYLKRVGNLEELKQDVYQENLEDGSAFYKFMTVQEKDFNKDNLETLLKSFYTEYDDFQKKEKEFAKNTTLVIFLQLDDLETITTDRDLQNTISLLEEDQYFFAKTVIPCTQELLDNWSMREDITDFIFDKDKFLKFKENQYTDSQYFFAYQLLTNLPFMKLDKGEESLQEIEDYLKLEVKYNQEMVDKYLQEGADLLDNESIEQDQVKAFLIKLGMKDHYED
jgi:competence CoiA-like predicted nuclease